MGRLRVGLGRRLHGTEPRSERRYGGDMGRIWGR